MKYFFEFRATYEELKKTSGKSTPETGLGINARHDFNIDDAKIFGDYRYYDAKIMGRAFLNEGENVDTQMSGVLRFFTERLGRDAEDFRFHDITSGL